MSKAALLEKLTDKTYRDAFVSDEIDVGLPMQLRSMREARGWKQKDVAEKTGTKQSRFSLMEKPGYGRFSLNTLKKIASIFDVGLIVSFVPYSEMIDFVNALSNRRLAICGFAAEYPRLAKRYAPRDETKKETTQGELDFTEKTFTEYATASDTSTQTIPVSSTNADFERVDMPGFYQYVSRAEDATNARE
jgi:transcriptional regulator with XRE-family HTH domain